MVAEFRTNRSTYTVNLRLTGCMLFTFDLAACIIIAALSNHSEIHNETHRLSIYRRLYADLAVIWVFYNSLIYFFYVANIFKQSKKKKSKQSSWSSTEKIEK